MSKPRVHPHRYNFYKMRYFVIIVAFVLIMLFLLENISKTTFYPVPHEHLPLTNVTFIYVITPTYARPVQKAELTRMSHTLRLVPNVHWVIVEDATEHTRIVANLLKNSHLAYTHLIYPTPAQYKPKSNERRSSKPRGVVQRNTALDWVRQNLADRENGVVYFADDDNTYTTELFEEMKTVEMVGVWPVGLVGGLYVETPLVENGKVVGFNSAWRQDRKFPIDMAGFAISLKLLHSKPDVAFSYHSEAGFQETDFLSSLTTRDQLEPKAQNCTKILVWHTRTEKPSLEFEERLKRQKKRPSNWMIQDD